MPENQGNETQEEIKQLAEQLRRVQPEIAAECTLYNFAFGALYASFLIRRSYRVGRLSSLPALPSTVVSWSEAEERVERARQYLDDHADEPITLRQLAAHIDLSPFHLQRTFTKRVGLSPKGYQNAKRMERFTASLKRGENITTSTYETGFGSSSGLNARVHEALGMTPSAFRSGGKGVTLRYTTVPTVVGRVLVAVTARGIAAVGLGESEAALVASLSQRLSEGGVSSRQERIREACVSAPQLPQRERSRGLSAAGREGDGLSA